MPIKLTIIIGLIISFILSLLLDAVRSFLLRLPSIILRYFKDKNFKCYKLSFHNAKVIKGLCGKYYFCSFDNKTYIINSEVLSSEIVIYKTSILSNRPSSTIEENTKGIPEDNRLESETEKGYNLSNDDLTVILSGFSLYKQEKQILFLSETLYTAIRSKLRKRKISLSIYSENDSFTKIPFCKLSERDFRCFDSKLSIEKS